ncbi:hypothetical protein [Methylobacter sp.]|uniref:hypothetical protein n=1 Tax=Methylobacter sp. TaxID=2051955 RepID=UPI0012279E8D|nr:hypothetical protein [Methylobacter sp.]TAK59782.1 MAG: hypothetical protein EPO18_19655 [Methylobacter sp.]
MALRYYPPLVHIIRNSIHIILITAVTAVDIPLCTEIIMAKGRIIMIMTMVIIMVELIFHIIANMINTMSNAAGIMIIQRIINAAEIMIIPLTIEMVANITITMTVIAITSTIETMINGLPPINISCKFKAFISYERLFSKFSMAILGISPYNAVLSR